MSTVAGVFASQADAERAVDRLRAIGLSEEKVVLLAPDGTGRNGQRRPIPTSDTEQPGMGAAVGGVVGGAVGVASGLEAGAALSAAIPGVGPILAMGMLGAAVLGIAGAGLGAAAGSAFEDATAKGLPMDEWFIYEDALRKGRTIVMAFPDEAAADAVRVALAAEGAETIDPARKQWWVGLRDAEKEHYKVADRTFDQDEDFYRMGFEAALDARNRGKGCDQVLTEMAGELEAISKNNPRTHVSEAFRRGYERGQTYYRDCCEKTA